MALARVACRAQLGLEAPLVHVEVSVAHGLPALLLVGLPATVVKESKERVRAALLNSEFEFPSGRITVNLSPADLPKGGGWFDLPIALGILLASGQIALPGARGRDRDCNLEGCEFYGELGLSGELKSIRGLLLAAARAAESGHEIIVPRANTEEACRVADIVVRGAGSLSEVCAHLERRMVLPASQADAWTPLAITNLREMLDLRDIRGQSSAKRALAVAAAGGHSLLFVGAPGSGKSTLARRLPALLPPMTEGEALEVASVASASSTGFDSGSFGIRPFRAPHHTASAASIIGGGSLARPGEISLAHHGVLFLDELPEFERRVLEALREPLETGEVAIARAARRVRYPAAFQLIAAMNACPCGYLGDDRATCHCSPDVIQRYRGRISGPLLDRLDLHVGMVRVPTRELLQSTAEEESSSQMAARVCVARECQIARQGVANARLGSAGVARYCNPDRAGMDLVERAVDRFALSARAFHRVLKVSRTIADLEGAESATRDHVAQALGFRVPDHRQI